MTPAIRAILPAICLVSNAIADLPSQTGALDPHWGASAFPAEEPETRLTISFNRFTEFSKTGAKYNPIDESIGFNLLSLSFAERVTGLQDLTYSIQLGAGPTSDEPTKFLQNEYAWRERLGAWRRLPATWT